MEMYEQVEKEVTLLPKDMSETTESNTGGVRECDSDNTRLMSNIDDIDIKTISADDDEKTICHCSSSTFKVVIGFVIVVFIAVSWTGATQFGKSTYSKTFSAPYFTTWFTTCFTVVLYPLFFIPLIGKKRPWRLNTFFRESAKILGPQGICVQSVILYLVRYILAFCTLWLLTNYLYFLSLTVLMPGTVTAVFSSQSCFVYVLSLFLLKDKLYGLRMFAVLLAVGGIILMSYSEGFGSTSAHGIIYVALAALGSALYQVMFKRVMGNASGSQVALFLTLLGTVNILLFWFIVVIFYYTNHELLEWDHMPWKFLVGTALLGVVFNYLVNFGISYTYPLFISIGALLGMPLSALVDAVFRGSSFGMYKIIATCMILSSFCFMLITNEKLDKVEQHVFPCCCKEQTVHGEEDDGKNVVENGDQA